MHSNGFEPLTFGSVVVSHNSKGSNPRDSDTNLALYLKVLSCFVHAQVEVFHLLAWIISCAIVRIQVSKKPFLAADILATEVCATQLAATVGLPLHQYKVVAPPPDIRYWPLVVPL